MQNFTFGRKGLNWFLFFFFLFVGKLSASYALNCVTLDSGDESQNFCYLSRVSELNATPNGDGLRWYRTSSSTSPIPNDEILQNGSYFAGNNSGNCTDREEVVVTVDDLGPPTSTFGNFYEPCVYSTTDPTTVEDLKDLITASNVDYDLNVYDEEYGDDSSELDDDFVLIDGGNYFIGQDDPDSDCQYSSRIAIEYNPINAPAPTANASQEFCESDNPTVADLVATGTSDNTQAIRWYSTSTSNPMLDSSTPLVDGETYYASQIVNRTNSTLPPCESTDRVMVTATVLTSDAGPNNTDTVLCVSDADSQLNNTTNARTYFLSLLTNNLDGDTENDVPTDGTFSDGSIAQIVSDYTDGSKVDTYNTTYTVTFANGCVDSVNLAVRVEEDPYAGEDNDETICIADIESFLPLNPALIPLAETAILEYFGGSGIDTPGTFSPSISDLFTQINSDFTDDNFPQTYTVVYTVNNMGCTNSATLQLTIQNENNAGSSQLDEQCVTDVEDSGIFDSDDTLKAYYIALLGAEDTEGTFSPELSTLRSAYNNGIDGDSEDFTTTYTVNTSSECDPASATGTLTVDGSETADAGTIDPQELCSNDVTVDLSTYLGGNSAPGGTFSSTTADVEDGTFDPEAEGAGTYAITYTVSETDPTTCLTGTDKANFTITVYEAPNAGPGGIFTYCVSEFTDLVTQIQANPAGEGVELLNALDPTITAGGEFSDSSLEELLAQYAATTSFPASFNTTYTVSNDDCTDSAEYTITITPIEEANAGDEFTVSFCTTDEVIDLSNSLAGDVTTGGIFTSDDFTITDGMFIDPAAAGPGDFTVTYTVNGDDDVCVEGSDSVDIAVTVVEFYELGATVTDVVCTNEVSEDYFTESNLKASFLELLPSDAPMDGIFNPSIADLSADYTEGKTVGDFTTLYTIANDDCNDSVSLTIIVQEVIDAELEEVDPIDPVCRNADILTLTDFIGDNPDFGVFEGYEDGTFNPGFMGAGTYDINYTISSESSECVNGTATITLTIIVLESAYAGTDMDLSVCMDAGEQNLFDFLSADADTNGEFSLDDNVITDGVMNPANFAAGDYEVTYTVAEINDCGDDTATFNITVEEAPGAPTVEGNPFTFCAIDVATVANLSATGTNLTYYSDAELTTMVMAEDELETGSYYVTQRNDEGACESAATEIMVTINDAATPTISNATQEFCEFDDSTVADLTDAVNETGNITWYDSADGDNALAEGTPLQDGSVYYATLFDVDSGCESSVRLAVTVSINDDCPITIPEAFSPNGDGFNDLFEIRNIRDKYPNFTIKIRNRFGDMVYQGNASTPDWDGFSSESSFGSDVLPVGAYFYYLDYNDGSTEPVRGTVYLSR